jgi:hypothetical protein
MTVILFVALTLIAIGVGALLALALVSAIDL